ncbi:MAG: sigma-70 family RNA polymerase sigma factor [Gemmatimonadota bacterium]|nr:sigma-70 family RNA polymerase sigma factor [Gemmatimonadota bacterium]
MNEARLLERACAGDRGAMGELYAAHAGRVFSVVRRLVGDDHAAEDVAHDAWLRAFDRLGTFRGDAAFGTWMHRLAVNTALNALRRSGRRPEVEQGAPAPAQRSPGDGAMLTQRVLERAIDRLPEGYRRVLVLHDVEGWTHEEIAQRLGVTVGTSKSQLHKARARMRDLLEPAGRRTEVVELETTEGAERHV